MAGVRGVRNPMPSKGESPTGIFSTHGKQKKDELASVQRKNKKFIGSKFRKERIDPVKRNNGLK